MASGTMRETVVSSPQPAITLQSGFASEEGGNTPCCHGKTNSAKVEDALMDEVKNVGINFYSNSALCCSFCRTPFPTSYDLKRHMSLHGEERQSNEDKKRDDSEDRETKVTEEEEKQKNEEKTTSTMMMSTPKEPLIFCTNCNKKFLTNEQRHHHLEVCRIERKDDDCSNQSEDCLISNNIIESNISTSSTTTVSPKSSGSKSTCSESLESDDSYKAAKSSRMGLRSAAGDHRDKSETETLGETENQVRGEENDFDQDDGCERAKTDKKRLASESEAATPNRRKVKTLNNNIYNNNNNKNSNNHYPCPACERELNSWNALQLHLENSHPDYEIKCEWCNLSFDNPRVLNLHKFMAHNTQEDNEASFAPTGRKPETRKRLNFDSGRCKIDRKSLRNLPKVIGFQDINFIDFSSEKFPLIAKNICEKSLHLSKDEFSFDCSYCGRGFPCSTALEIHLETCENNAEKLNSPKVEKKNKRKSTPMFRPQNSAGSDSDDSENMEIKVSEQQRKEFFNSLDLRNREKSPTSDETNGDKKMGRADAKPDLADIQSILSVTNIPGISVKTFSGGQQDLKRKSPIEENSPGTLNVHVGTCRSSPESFHSNMSMSSPGFNVLNLISPNYSGNDMTEEEAQDCFAAECRRMKLRGEFPCKLCTAIFPNLRALKGHNRVHISVANGTPNSPYRCNICTYHSLDKATLVRHMRSHNGDRPYECAMCNYAFTTKANCERHLRNRHSKITRDEVKSSIIYHPSEDPINDADYQKTTNEMNRRNLEKSKEKPEFSLPVNLKINLSNLKDSSKSEDLFQVEHQELIRDIKNEEEHKKTEAGTMTEDMESDTYNDWEFDDNEKALDLRIGKVKNYESDSSDVPQDLSKKEEVKEFNNNIDEKLSKREIHPNLIYEDFGKANLDINNLVKMYSTMYPSLNTTQLHQIILTQLNFPGILSKLHNFPFSPFIMSSPLFSGSGNYFQKNLQKDVIGLQMSGGNILDDKNHGLSVSEKLQFFQQQAFAEILLKREKDRIANEYFGKNSAGLVTEDVEKQKRLNEYFSESEKNSFGDILLNSRRDEKKETMKITSSSEKSAADSRNSSVKMVIKNGVLIPKQKQRRYRTERPFSCEHCSARFTLRSNMERHIKQQHPQYWTQKSRSNVGNLKKSELTPIKINSFDRDFGLTSNMDYLKRCEMNQPISLLPRGNINSSNREIKWEPSVRFKQEFENDKEEVVNLARESVKDIMESTKVKQEDTKRDKVDEGVESNEVQSESAISEGKAEKVKKSIFLEGNRCSVSINSSKHLKSQESSEKVETEKENFKDNRKDLGKESQPQDLASVSKMLDNAVTQTQTFQKFFQEGSKKEEESRRGIREDVKREAEGDRSEEEEGLVAGSTSSDENRSEYEVSSRSGKKKSAYSLAPNRVSCPYCFRKFPWTSSLRRHVLTHTGQKPFKCTHCPLLFTTKSNCDRHLLRKHGREALIASSGQTENPESSGAPNLTSVSNHSQNSNYPMRNVPERPYKCSQCPSSTFSTLSNLNKHLFSKHNGQSRPESMINEQTGEGGKIKSLNPQAPPNVTISTNFALALPRTLSVVSPYGDAVKTSSKVSNSKAANTGLSAPPNCNGLDREKAAEDAKAFRKRSSSEEIDAIERKKTSPDIKAIGHEAHEFDSYRSELLPIPPSELPFKCHLCDSSFGERADALEHIRCQHPNEFSLLVSKGALETNTDEEKHQHDENEEVLDSTRGRFPDYANRKVMCAFCMRRFWSAEDLRRHMRTHTGERPFSCDVCQRRFTLKHSMLRHRKKHNAQDEVLVGSDEEHHNPYQVNHNNNISVAMSALQKPAELTDELHRTILHQTLTRCDENKDDLRKDFKMVDEVAAFK